MKTFQKMICKFCKGKTHRQAAQTIGVPLWTLRNWIYGKAIPGKFTSNAVAKIIEAYDAKAYD